MDVVQLASELIRFRTENPPGDEALAAEWVAQQCRVMGMDVRLSEVSSGRANCVARLTFSAGPVFVLCTHLDVVPAQAEGWGPVVRDGRLFGRGSCDAKGALAAMLVAAGRLAADPRGAAGSLVIAAVCDEEVAATGARHLAAEGLAADCFIIGEPTGNELVLRSKGVLRAVITFTGRSGHASQPTSGVSAIRAAAELVLAVDDYDRELQASGRGTCVATMIEGGSGVNVIPDRCSVVLDRRIGPDGDGASVDDAERELDLRLREWVTDPRASWTRSTAGVSVDVLDTRSDGPVARALLKALGQRSTGAVFPAVTDAPHFAVQGAPAFILGPGSIEQAHTAEEWVDLSALDEAVRCYERAARAILVPAGGS
jgi:succinyl-diaminopimelate desuccinylase